MEDANMTVRVKCIQYKCKQEIDIWVIPNMVSLGYIIHYDQDEPSQTSTTINKATRNIYSQKTEWFPS